jgi:membrane-associated protease RseP (regulator of RpoE activity)
MRLDRIVLAASVLLLLPFAANAQDPAAASKPASAPAAAETSPSSRPAEPRARHPRIGLRCDPVALEKQGVARVEEVKPGSPAEKAGIKVGDVILKVGSDEIRDDKSYREALGRKRAGDQVSLTLRRGGDEQTVEVTPVDKLSRTEPDAVTVQHVLVKAGSDKPDPRQPVQPKQRTVEEARKLAEDILRRAKNGADFAELVRTYSEDPGSVKNDPAGSYVLANDGKPKPTPTAIDRSQFVAAFTALAFSLEVGDVAMTTYDAELSPFGFHVIKRVK